MADVRKTKRAVWAAVVAIGFVGCSGKGDPANPTDETTVVEDAQEAISGQTIINDYFDNSFAADQKYQNKKIHLTKTVSQIKTVNGAMQLWVCAEPGGVLPLIVFDTKRQPGPGAKGLKINDMVVIEGVCRGHVDDGRHRIPAPGWTFQINVTECTIIESGKHIPVLR